MKYDIQVLLNEKHPQYDEAVNDWFSYLETFLSKRCHDYSLRQDVIQETYIKALLKKDQYDPQKSRQDDGGRAWVTQIAVYTLSDLKRKRREIVSDNDDMDFLPPKNDDFERADEITDLIGFTRECVGSLPDETQKTVFLLAFNAGMTNGEIARQVESTEQEIKEKRTYTRNKILSCIDIKTERKWGKEKTFKKLIEGKTRDEVNEYLKFLAGEVENAYSE